MSDTLQRPSFRVVFYGSSLDSEAETTLDQYLATFNGAVFVPSTTVDGSPAFVSDEASAQNVFATVMDDSSDLRSDIGIGAIRFTEDVPAVVNTDDLVHIKAPGSEEVNGSFTTIMDIITTSFTTEREAGSDPVDTFDDVHWTFDSNEADEVVDSAATDTADSAEGAPDTEPDTDDAVDTSGVVHDVQDAEPDTDDAVGTHRSSEDTSEEDSRELIISQLVDHLVPKHVTEDVSTPLTPSADYPADMTVLIDALVSQANTMLRFRCREADADVGLLSDEQVAEEKTRLVESLLIKSPPPITDYVSAINYLDQVIADVEAQVDEVRAEFQRREDDWVEDKLAQVIPQLREIFRSTYPTTKEKVSQEVLDAAQPEISSAEKQVDETETRARHNVALALRHQSDVGRNLSSLLLLHELRADMKNDLDAGVARLLDSHAQQQREQEEQQQARIAEIEATAQAKADAYAQKQIEAALTEQQQAHAISDTEADTDVDDSAGVIDSEHAEDDSEAVVDSDAAMVVDSEQDSHDDTDAEQERNTPAEGEVDNDPAVETEMEPGVSTIALQESYDENSDADSAEEADNHPSIGDVSRAGGDSSTSLSDEPTGAFASPIAHNTDPHTGEDLDFREEDYEQPRRGRARNALRRLFGRS